MFILRQISKGGLESNLCLGERYVITYRDSNQETFKELLKRTVTHPDNEKVFAIIDYQLGKDGMENYPLYEDYYYYIMTESGRTFANLSCK